MDELLKLIKAGADIGVIQAEALKAGQAFADMATKVSDGVVLLAKQKESTDKFRDRNTSLLKAYKRAFGDEVDFENFDEDKFVTDVQQKMKTGDATLDALEAKYREEIESKNTLISKLGDEKMEMKALQEKTVLDFTKETAFNDAINSIPYEFRDSSLIDPFKSMIAANIKVEDGQVIPMERRDNVNIPMMRDGKQLTMRDFALIKAEELKDAYFKGTTTNGSGGSGGNGGSFHGKNYGDMNSKEKIEFAKRKQ